MNHLSVGFDLDDVLLPSGIRMVEWHNERYGTNLSIDHWYVDNTVESWAVKHESEILERINMFVSSEDYFSGLQPIEGATRLLDELDAAGDHKFGVTGRSPALAKVTYRALEVCYPGAFPLGTVNFINHSTINRKNNKLTKLQIALTHKATHIMDDLPEHLLPMPDHGIKGLVYGDYPHNRDVVLRPELVRVATMNDARLELRRDREL